MEATRENRPIRLKPQDTLFFNRQVASFARLGMPISKGLRILARDIDDPDFKHLIQQVQQDLDEGRPLQDALARFPETFSALHIEIVRAGESTGNLAVILEELNAHATAMERIKARILEAVFYPAVIATAVFGFVLFFLLKLAPQFKDMIIKRSTAMAASSAQGFQGEDPLAPYPLTRMLFAISDAVSDPIVLALLLVLTTVGVFLTVRRFRRLGEEWDDVLFGLPLFGKLFEGAALMKITRTMRDLLQNGISMVETLRLTARTVGQNRLQQKLDELRRAVEEGGSFSRNLAGGDVFPDTMVWKLQMAEEKGLIERALEELANEFEVAVDRQTAMITKLMAPAILVGMGGVVFVMFMACLVPLTTVHAG